MTLLMIYGESIMRTVIIFFLVVIFFIALAATASAQVTFAGLGSPGLVEMSYLPTAAYPNGDSPVPPLGGFPNASLLLLIVVGGFVRATPRWRP